MKRYLFLLSLSIVMINVSLLAQTYHVGDVYTAPDMSQGIVYYLFPDGSGGLVVALNDASEGCIWGDDEDVPGLTNRSFYSNTTFHQMQDDTSGYNNTLVMREYYENGNSAAWMVDFDNGWFLPSPWQLRLLYSQLPFIHNSLLQNGGTTLGENCYYWCSTESSSTYAWGMTTYAGNYIYSQKNSLFRVRAVRCFNYYSDAVSYHWSTGATSASITLSPTQTTTYTVTVTTASGFTDVAEKTIVVGGALPYEFTIVTTEPYLWDGVTYDESGDYTRVYHLADGCDSVVTLHLLMSTMPNIVIHSDADTVCPEETVLLQASVTNHIGYPPVSIGDILCTDNSIVKPSEWPMAGKTALGVVFYVDATGEHGWAVHLHDQGTNVQWSSTTFDVSSLPNYSGNREAINDLDGYSNTQLLRNAGNATVFPAAWLVDFPDGWYLPAIGQLNLLHATVMMINPSLQKIDGTVMNLDLLPYYWSSTERNNNYAWYLLASSGTIGSFNKTFNSGSPSFVVRSVRDF